MDMDPSPRLEVFPIRAICTGESVGFSPLTLALRDALGLPADAKPHGGAWLTSAKAGAKLQGGLRVVGTKRRTFRGAKIEVVCVSLVAFDAEGRLVGWSRDVPPGSAEDPVELRFCRPDGGTIELTAEMKKALKALSAATSAPAGPPALTPSAAGKRTRKQPAGGAGTDAADTPARFVADADIVNVALTADAQIAATIDRTNALSFWDMRDGTRITKVAIQRDTGALALSPDGQRIAVGRTKIELRYVGAPEADVVLEGHPKGEVVALAWAPDGARVASLSAVAVKGADNTLVVWDASSGEALCRAKLKRPSGMLFSRNGKAVVCATYDGLVALSPRTGATLATAFDGERIEEIVELSDGVLVMLGQSLDDGELVVVHPETLAEVRRVKLPGLLYPVAAGSVVVGRNESRNGLVLGDAKKGRIVRSTALTEGEIGPYAIAANGATVVVALGTRLVVLGEDLAPRGE